MKTKYYIISGADNLKRIKNGKVQCFFFDGSEWKKSLYTAEELKKSHAVQITETEAKKLCKKAFAA